MDFADPSYISCTEDEQKDDVSIFFRDTLENKLKQLLIQFRHCMAMILHKRTGNGALVFV